MQPDHIFPKSPMVNGLLVVGIFTLLAWPLDMLPLKFEEPRRALVALEMMYSGNYWAPTIHGEFYYNKPPLFNWLLAGLFVLLGPENWVERLPTLFSITVISLTIFFFFRKKVGAEVAALSALAFTLSGHMLFYFSFQGEIDATFSFVVVMQALCVMHFFHRRRWSGLFFTSYLLMTAGFLLKGLPSVAFQGLTLLGILVLNGQWRKLLHYSHFLAMAASLLLIIGYFYQYSGYHDPELMLAKLTIESSRRVSGHWMDYLLQWIKFPFLLIILMLPGSLLLILFRRYEWYRVTHHPWMNYCYCFLLVNLPIYWLAPGTRDRYLYMFLPFLYILIFYLGIRALKQNAEYVRWLVNGLAGIVAIALVILAIVPGDFSTVWSLVGAVLLLTLILIGRKDYLHPVLGIIVLMIVLRFIYNVVVFPIRQHSPDNVAAVSHAERVFEIADGRKVYLVSKAREQTLQLPFRDVLSYTDFDRLPYQFTFYYSKLYGDILPWRAEPNGNDLYLIGASEAAQGEVLYDFEMQGRQYMLMSPRPTR